MTAIFSMLIALSEGTHAAQNPCRVDLRQFLAELVQENPEIPMRQIMQAIRQGLRDAGLPFSSVEQAEVLEAHLYSPIIKKGIVDEALAEAILASGVSPEQVEAKVASFPRMEFSEQMKLLSAAADRFVYVLDDLLARAKATPGGLLKLAQDLGMTKEEMARFSIYWKNFDHTHYDEAKVLLFSRLIQADRDQAKAVVEKASGPKHRPWIANASKVSGFPQRPAVKPLDYSAPLWKHSAMKEPDVLAYLNEADAKLADLFVRANAASFDESTLRGIERNDKISRKLGEATLAQVEARAGFLETVRTSEESKAELGSKEQVASQDATPIREKLQVLLGRQVHDSKYAKVASKVLVILEDESLLRAVLPEKTQVVLDVRELALQDVPPNFKTLNFERLSPRALAAFVNDAVEVLGADQLKRLEAIGDRMPKELLARVQGRLAHLQEFREEERALDAKARSLDAEKQRNATLVQELRSSLAAAVAQSTESSALSRDLAEISANIASEKAELIKEMHVLKAAQIAKAASVIEEHEKAMEAKEKKLKETNEQLDAIRLKLLRSFQGYAAGFDIGPEADVEEITRGVQAIEADLAAKEAKLSGEFASARRSQADRQTRLAAHVPAWVAVRQEMTQLDIELNRFGPAYVQAWQQGAQAKMLNLTEESKKAAADAGPSPERFGAKPEVELSGAVDDEDFWRKLGAEVGRSGP